MQTLRLAVFNTQPPHLYFGGVERRIVETAKRLKNNVDMTVYSGTKHGFRKPVSSGGMNIVPCFSTDTLFPLDNWVFNRTIAGATSKIRANVYEAHTVSGYAFLRALRKNPKKASFIQTVHGVLADEYFQALRNSGLSYREKLANLLMWKLSKLEAESSRNADMVITVSRYSMERIAQLYGVEETKIRVVPNGVDPEKFKPTSNGDQMKQRYRLNSKQVVLFVGRLIPRKGLTYLIQAAKQVIRENADTAFMIVGNGPLKNKLTSDLEKSNISRNFFFLGDVDDEALQSLYGVADIFVLPSLQEGQGIALLEAQSSCKPVVAFNIGGVNETVVNEKSGLLVERGNSKMLGNAILELLSNDSLRRKMGSFAREFVKQNFTWDICAEKMLKVYHESLDSLKLSNLR